MITHVNARKFKGLSFEDKFSPLTLILGPNGCGKSARSQAITLTLLGFLPGIAKANKDIVRSFGNDISTAVGITVTGGKTFSRQFLKSMKSGRYSEKCRVNSKVVNKTKFTTELAREDIGVFDVAAFNKMSDNDKIDLILDLFPPGDTDIRKLNGDIESAKDDQSNTTEAISTLKKSIQGLEHRMSIGETPDRSEHDVRARIDDLEKKMTSAQENLNEEYAKKAVAEAAQAKEEEKAREEERAKETAPPPKIGHRTAHNGPPAGKTMAGQPANYEAEPKRPYTGKVNVNNPEHKYIPFAKRRFPGSDLEKIKKAMEMQGCQDTCTAYMLVLAALKK